MPEYKFIKTGIEKGYAMDVMFKDIPTYQWFTYGDPELVVSTSRDLTEIELSDLQNTIDNYSDPVIWMSLNSTIPDTIRSITINSPTLKTVQSFIYSNTFNGSGTFNAIKSVFEYATDNVQSFIDFTGTASVTYEIFCYTRQVVICSHEIDVTDICNEWKTAALNGATGDAQVYRTFMVEGLRNSVASYDCIWNYRLAVSHPSINVTIHAKQMLYYDIIV